MTVAVLGLDALDPELVDPERHPNLALADWRSIDTIPSAKGEPSTHELWPSIITGLHPEEHGLTVEDGPAWDSAVVRVAARIGDRVVPDGLQTRIGAWILNTAAVDVFRTPASYYDERGIETVFDGRVATAIGVPNYVTDPDRRDREHELRRQVGDLFERDPTTTTGHESADPVAFYEVCMEMAMVRIARVRRAVRGRRHELVFGYTSGLDLLGHVAHDLADLQRRAYDELDDFVGELRRDLREDDELLVVSDHGLQDGLHTHEAFISGTVPGRVDGVRSVLDVRSAIEAALEEGDHEPSPPTVGRRDAGQSEAVRRQLEDLGYM